MTAPEQHSAPTADEPDPQPAKSDDPAVDANTAPSADQDDDNAARRDATSPESAARDQSVHTTYLVEDVATGKRRTVRILASLAQRHAEPADDTHRGSETAPPTPPPDEPPAGAKQPPPTFDQLLRAERSRACLTVRDLAERIGVPWRHLFDVELGKTVLSSLSQLDSAIEAMGTSAETSVALRSAWVDACPDPLSLADEPMPAEPAAAEQVAPTFGQLLRAERERAGITAQAIARLSGIPEPLLSRLERDEAVISSVSQLDTLLDQLGPTEANEIALRSAWVAAVDASNANGSPPDEDVNAAPATATADTGPVCSTCNDTHRMELGDREVMCTYCPRPCDRCRAGGKGAYCETTPCSCTCHQTAVAPPCPPRWMPASCNGCDPTEHVPGCAAKAELDLLEQLDGLGGRVAELVRRYRAACDRYWADMPSRVRLENDVLGLRARAEMAEAELRFERDTVRIERELRAERDELELLRGPEPTPLRELVKPAMQEQIIQQTRAERDTARADRAKAVSALSAARELHRRERDELRAACDRHWADDVRELRGRAAMAEGELRAERDAARAELEATREALRWARSTAALVDDMRRARDRLGTKLGTLRGKYRDALAAQRELTQELARPAEQRATAADREAAAALVRLGQPTAGGDAEELRRWRDALETANADTFAQANHWLDVDAAGVTDDGQIFVRRGADTSAAGYQPCIRMTEQLRDLAGVINERDRQWMRVDDDAPGANTPDVDPLEQARRERDELQRRLDDDAREHASHVANLHHVTSHLEFEHREQIAELKGEIDRVSELRDPTGELVAIRRERDELRQQIATQPAVSGDVAELLAALLADELDAAGHWLDLTVSLATSGELVAWTEDGHQAKAPFNPKSDLREQIADLDIALRAHKDLAVAAREPADPTAIHLMNTTKALLERGPITVSLDTRAPGIDVPPVLRGHADVSLRLAYSEAMHDLIVGPTGIVVTILDDEAPPFRYVLPWSAVRGVEGKPDPALARTPAEVPT